MSDKQPQSSRKRRVYQNDECIEKLQELYLDTETADVRFSFGPTRNDDTANQVAAHKSLLAGISDVFKAMFFGKIKETGNVHVPDTSEAAFMEFLRYFYMRKVKLSAEHVEEVLYLGQKYNVEKCVSDCFRYLIKLLDDENVCNHLRLAILYEHPKLMKVCEKRILMNIAAVFKSVGFLECDRRVLEHILTKGLTLCSESMVFEAMMSWVKAKCKKDVLSKALVERHLGDLFYEIRFATMTIEEFCALAEQTQYKSVLSSHHTAITNMIVLKKASNRFKTTPRNVKWCSDMMYCDRISTGSRSSYTLDLIDETKFSANKPLILNDFICSRILGKLHQALISDLVVDVKIYEYRNKKFKDDNGKLLSEMKANLKSEIVRVSLLQPVIVKPEFYYVIQIGPLPREHRYISYNSLQWVQMGSGVRIDFYDHLANEDDSSDDSDDSDDDDDDDEIEVLTVKNINDSDTESNSNSNTDTDTDTDSDSDNDTEIDIELQRTNKGGFIRELSFKRILI